MQNQQENDLPFRENYKMISAIEWLAKDREKYTFLGARQNIELLV